MMRPALLLTAAASAAASADGAAPPVLPLLRINGTLLSYAAARYAAGDPNIVPAAQAVISSARAYVGQAPLSVTSKRITLYPMSSDPKYYQSFATYFMDCRSCCPLANAIDVSTNGPACTSSPPACNATTGLPYKDCDGLSNEPMINQYHSPLWGNARGGMTGPALAYYLTRDEQYANVSASFIRAWFTDPVTGMHPTLQYSQFIPGLCTGRPQGVIDFSNGGGFISVLDAVTMLGGSGAWSGADQSAMRSWTAAFLDWLLTGPTAVYDWQDEPNNHATWIHTMIVGTASWLGNATVLQRFTARLPPLLASQMNATGELYLEARRARGLTYDNMCLSAWFNAAQEVAGAGGGGIGLDLYRYQVPAGGSLQAGIRFLLPYALQGQCWPYEQFTGYDWGSTLWQSLRQAAAVYNNATYADLACQVPLRPGDSFDADVINLLWPWPPTATPHSVKYCTAAGLQPAVWMPRACQANPPGPDCSGGIQQGISAGNLAAAVICSAAGLLVVGVVVQRRYQQQARAARERRGSGYGYLEGDGSFSSGDGGASESR